MTNISEIARLGKALQNGDASPEHASVQALDKDATPAPKSLETAKSGTFSAMVEYAMIAAYVVLAAAMFMPPYVCTMSRVIGNLLRSL